MDIQRLRNLTTHLLHTKMEHIYQDLEFIIGDDGIMTHMIPRVRQAIEPWLREQITDARFWDGEYDITHTGEYPLRAMTPEESEAALKRYAAMPNPLAGKEIIPVVQTSVMREHLRRCKLSRYWSTIAIIRRREKD
jgi:hypothetical protein